MNKLYFGDNLHVLRKYVPDESVDLIYLDPPFNSKADYNVLFRATSGRGHRAQIQAFEDTWRWGEEAEEALDRVRATGGPSASIIRALRDALGPSDMMAYLVMMAARLSEMHRVMRPSAALYLHCDPTASHYLKVILDAIFGPVRFANEIIWKRTTAHSSSKRFAPVHDVILYYRKSSKFTWSEPRSEYEEEYLNKYYKFDDGDGRLYWRADITGAGSRNGDSGQPWRDRDPTRIKRHWALPEKIVRELAGEAAEQLTIQEKLEILDRHGRIYWPKGSGMPQYKRYREALRGPAMPDIWDDLNRINPVGSERLGYPTQKPLALLERIVASSTKEGDVILDPFCGCGTTVHAAQKLGRRWIGIDITHLAIQVIADRLGRWMPEAKYEIIGQPRDLAGAEELARIDKYQFQWWATWLCGGQPAGGGKKGADGGVDGTLEFATGRGQQDWGIVSVKGGRNVGVDMVRQLEWAVRNENASIGVLVTLAEPTRDMKTAAVTAGTVELAGVKYPRIQIRTVEQLLSGNAIETPFLLTTVQNTPAKSTRGAGSRVALSPTDALAQRTILLPIAGGRAGAEQASLDLPEPVKAAVAAPPPRRRRA